VWPAHACVPGYVGRCLSASLAGFRSSGPPVSLTRTGNSSPPVLWARSFFTARMPSCPCPDVTRGSMGTAVKMPSVVNRLVVDSEVFRVRPLT